MYLWKCYSVLYYYYYFAHLLTYLQENNCNRIIGPFFKGYMLRPLCYTYPGIICAMMVQLLNIFTVCTNGRASLISK